MFLFIISKYLRRLSHESTQRIGEDDFIVLNPDTIWSNEYQDEIIKMEEIYFAKKLENILLLVNKNLSFDQNLRGDFNLSNDLITKKNNLDFIYIGCQILNKKILKNQLF